MPEKAAAPAVRAAAFGRRSRWVATDFGGGASGLAHAVGGQFVDISVAVFGDCFFCTANLHVQGCALASGDGG